jgi:hypothetical protein
MGADHPPAIIAALTLSNAFVCQENQLNGSMTWLTTTAVATQSRQDQPRRCSDVVEIDSGRAGSSPS